MNQAVLLLIVLNFIAIGALPIVFFRRDGALNLLWWLTAGPFFLCPLLLAGAYSGLLPLSLRPAALMGRAQELLAVALSASSIAMIFLTLGTHRTRIALWHQANDAPRSIVTDGAYRFIRHPFYAAFLLAFGAACVFFPHPAILALAVYVLVLLDRTAAREEKRLGASEFGEEYRAYLKRTGRFLPRLRMVRPS